MARYERYSELDRLDTYRQFMTRVIDKQNEIWFKNDTYEDVDTDLRLLVGQINPLLERTGCIGAGAVIHEGARSYRRVDEADRQSDSQPSYEIYDMEDVIVGGYRGLHALQGELVHMVDMDNRLDDKNLERHAFAPVANPERFTLVKPPEAPPPDFSIEPIRDIRESIDQVTVSDYAAVWEEVKKYAREPGMKYLKEWFFEQSEASTGLKNRHVTCISDEVYYLRDDESRGKNYVVHSGKTKVTGVFLGLTTAPPVIESPDGNRFDHSPQSAKLALAIECSPNPEHLYKMIVGNGTILMPAKPMRP